jgi:hypothetical protein
VKKLVSPCSADVAWAVTLDALPLARAQLVPLAHSSLLLFLLIVVLHIV